MDIPRRRTFLLGVLALGGWLVVGSVGFSILEGWSLFEGLYMTVITMSTVGYGEVHELSRAGRILAMVLILGGISTAAYTSGTLVQAILEGGLRSYFGRRRMEKDLRRLENHFVLCGYGKIGTHVAEGLAEEKAPFCVVERDAAREEDLRALGYLYRIGDATNEGVLKEAGIERARALLALLPDDAGNLYLTMTAKALRPQLVVIAKAVDEAAEAKLRRGGASRVVSANRIASVRVLAAALRPTVLDMMELVTGRGVLALRIEEVRVAKGSLLDGKTLQEAEVRRRHGAMVVAVKGANGEMVFGPVGAQRILADDTLVAIGKEEDLRALGGACSAEAAR